MEYGLVTRAGYPFHHIEVNGIQRRLTPKNIARNKDKFDFFFFTDIGNFIQNGPLFIEALFSGDPFADMPIRCMQNSHMKRSRQHKNRKRLNFLQNNLAFKRNNLYNSIAQNRK